MSVTIYSRAISIEYLKQIILELANFSNKVRPIVEMPASSLDYFTIGTFTAT